MKKKTNKEASRWAYVGVLVLAGAVSFILIYLFAYVVQTKAGFSDPFYPILLSSILSYLLITASFITVYSQFPRVDPLRAAPWIMVISFLGLFSSYSIFYEIIEKFALDSFQHFAIRSAHLTGAICFNVLFFFWAWYRRSRIGAQTKESSEPLITGGKAGSDGGLLPYKARERSTATGFKEELARSGSPAPERPIAKSPKPHQNTQQPTVSDLVELLSSRQAQLDDLRSHFPKADKAIEYLSEVREAWKGIRDLPDIHIKTFLAAMDADPKCDPAEQVELVKQAYEKELNPFESEDMNAALAEAREIGRNAEREFLEVAGIFGDRISPSDILEKIYKKFRVPSPVLYELMNASKVFDQRKIRESIKTLGYRIKFTESKRGTKKYEIWNPESERKILRGELKNIRSQMLQNSRILKALRLSDDVKNALLLNARNEEKIREAIESFDEKRILDGLQSLEYRVERSPLLDRKYYEIIAPRSGNRTEIEDFVSLSEFAEKVLRAPLDKYDIQQ